jgi:multidrug efflux pump subunit AcrA (membrane-fusion protein)
MSAVIRVSFGALLDAAPSAEKSRAFGRGRVLKPFVVVSVVLALWASLAPISGAVIAHARIKVELERKTVQHREGGIVR